MILEAELSVPGPPQAVFDALVDPRRAAEAVPGARLTDSPAAEPGGAEDAPGVGAELRLQAGGSQITYRGRVVAHTADRAAGTLGCSVDAREARGAGVLRGRLDLRLDRAGDGTRMRVDADLEVTGRAERLGEERIRQAALRLLQRVATRIGESAVEEEETAVYAPPPLITLSAYDAQPRIPGEVRLTTERPLLLSSLPVSGGALDDVRVALRRRPWLAAAAVIAALLLLACLRRRGDGD